MRTTLCGDCGRSLRAQPSIQLANLADESMSQYRRRSSASMPERIVAVNGTELWVTELGSGPPMILCHGGPGCCDYLGPVAEMVDDRVHVYRFEPRGCGRSAIDGPYDLATSLADLEALRVH